MSENSTPSTLAFLNLLLPPHLEGKRCGFFKKGSQVQQAFFDGNGALAAACLAAAQGGWDAYHGCALLRDGSSRTSGNAAAVSAFWVDIDCGEDKSYAGLGECWTELVRFISQTNLPVPTTVCSGYGIHAYWFLDQPLTPQEWKRYAEGLRDACNTHELHCDHTRTCDVASILRPPGTFNYKHGGRAAVECDRLDGPYPIERFASLVSSIPQPRERVARPPAASSNLAERLTHVHAEAPEDRTADAEAIADGCAFMGHMRSTLGVMPEPEWKACMGVLAFCQDGEELAHEWSYGDLRYNEQETQDKYERSRELSGPTKCSHFSSLNPERCRKCPHFNKISTPVQLGRVVGPRAGTSVAGVSLEPVAAVGTPSLPPQLPGYLWGNKGETIAESTKWKEGKDAKFENLVIARNPVYVSEVNRGEIGYDNLHFVIRSYVPAEAKWSQIEMPVADAYGPAGMTTLAGRGVTIDEPGRFQKYMRDWYAHHMSRRIGTMYEQCGWKDNDSKFAIMDRLYDKGEVSTVSIHAELRSRRKAFDLAPGGSVGGWVDNARQLYSRDYEAQSFGLLCGFGAVFMRFVSPTEGGAIVSLVSPSGGKGKSTALSGVMSIWGAEDATKLTSATSETGRGLWVGRLCNLPAVWDEVTKSSKGERYDPDWLANNVRMFTDGVDKDRATSVGGLNHSGLKWQTILITSSNMSLIDKILQLSKTTAPTDRIIELDMKEIGVNDDATHVVKGMVDNRGHVGDYYMRYCTRPENLVRLSKRVVELRTNLFERYKFRPEHRFWARTLACATLAGEVASELKLIAFDPQEIVDWTVERMLDRMESNKRGRDDTAVGILSDFLGANIKATLSVASAAILGRDLMPDYNITGDRIVVRVEKDTGKAVIDQAALLKHLTLRDYPRSQFMRELKELGLLISEGRGMNLGSGTMYRASGVKPTIEVDIGDPRLSGVVRLIDKETRKVS